MKKLISSVAGFILIISIIILGFALTARKYLNVDSVQSMLKQVFHSTDSYNEYFFTTLVNGSTTKDSYKPYFNEEEIEELYTRYLAEYILYSNGVTDGERPEFDELKGKVDDYLADYERETGQEADRKGSFNFFYNLDENTANMTFFSEKVKKVIQFLLNDTVRDALIGIILVCIVLIIIFNRNLDKVILHISTVFISDGIGLLVLKFIIDKYLSAIIPNPFINNTMNQLSGKMSKVAIYSIIIGVIFLGIFVLYKIFFKRKEKPKLTEVTEAAIPTTDQLTLNPVPMNFQKTAAQQTGAIPIPVQQQPIPQPVQQVQQPEPVKEITSEFEFDFDSRPKNKKTRVQQVLESRTQKLTSGAVVTQKPVQQQQIQQPLQQPLQQPRPQQQRNQQPRPQQPKPKQQPKPVMPKQMPQPMQPKQDEPFVEQIFPDK